MKNPIFTTIINPPLLAGVSLQFLFLLLVLTFISIIFVNVFLGKVTMIISLSLIIWLYFYGKKRTKVDPYWLNSFFKAFVFEWKLKKPLSFTFRVLQRKEKKIYR